MCAAKGRISRGVRVLAGLSSCLARVFGGRIRGVRARSGSTCTSAGFSPTRSCRHSGRLRSAAALARGRGDSGCHLRARVVAAAGNSREFPHCPGRWSLHRRRGVKIPGTKSSLLGSAEDNLEITRTSAGCGPAEAAPSNQVAPSTHVSWRKSNMQTGSGMKAGFPVGCRKQQPSSGPPSILRARWLESPAAATAPLGRSGLP